MKTTIMTALLIFSSVLFASGDHGHGHGHGHSHGSKKISKERSGELGRKHVERLVRDEKIDKSWLKSSFIKSEQKIFKKKNEWVITFQNESGVKGKTLYIFLKTSGEFIAANFTGK